MLWPLWKQNIWAFNDIMHCRLLNDACPSWVHIFSSGGQLHQAPKQSRLYPATTTDSEHSIPWRDRSLKSLHQSTRAQSGLHVHQSTVQSTCSHQISRRAPALTHLSAVQQTQPHTQHRPTSHRSMSRKSTTRCKGSARLSRRLPRLSTLTTTLWRQAVSRASGQCGSGPSLLVRSLH